MATVDVVTMENQSAGTVELDPSVFEAAVKPHLFYLEVKRQLAGRRSGTHSTKNRSAVSGGGAKPWRQKGTGRARQGSTRSPQWKGGGAVFGPVPRGHSQKLPKKVRRAALRGALSQHRAEGSLQVVEDLQLDEYKTRRMVETLKGLGLADASVLLVGTAETPEQVGASSRNLPHVSFIRAEGLNVFDVLRHDKVVLTKAAVAELAARLGGGGEEQS